MLGGLSLGYRVLIATAATALLGSFANGPVKAADLGGDCCADLEERVAELEATTVRKGQQEGLGDPLWPREPRRPLLGRWT